MTNREINHIQESNAKKTLFENNFKIAHNQRRAQ